MGLNGSDTVLITGAGPVGLGGIVNARFRGARPIVVESVPWRRERAKQLGAQCVIDPGDDSALSQIVEVTEDKGVDCAVDCAGTVSAQRLCIDATRRKGKVAFVGQCHEDLRIKITPDLLWKGISLIGVWHYNLADYPRVMKVIQESPLIDSLISHVLPISKIQEAFELSASQETAKIILKPWE
ncbi:MAG: zinc-binding dehydrogenase [Armatimonadetes bacterium]|nr:zinc-binding dehydrogenase [Armatimonadota bacterium]NIO76069.1 zinc-binding dehydrogenase [Armatimonadota bacterium]NIO97007.1 zinc-binding dehydrogenase [Armatimonadota bacterium]